MLQWNRERFVEESKLLVDALKVFLIDNIERNDQDHHPFHSSFLDRWSLEQPDDGYDTIILIHPAVQREITVSSTENDQKHENRQDWTVTTDQEEEKEDLLCDDTVLQDDPEVSASSWACGANNDLTLTTEWHFSIVYSDTWRAPVLYFTVQNSSRNGSPFHRSEIVELLAGYSPSNMVEDTWDFLSQEEHPIFRHPSFFLHPCRTMERLSSVVLMNHESTEKNEKDRCLLLSWMALILPSVGCGIPARTYKMLEDYLADHYHAQTKNHNGEVEK